MLIYQKSKATLFMTKAYSIAVPRYHISGSNGEVFDVFNKKRNAIRAAINMATEYPGTTFRVIKKVFHKETIVFSFKIELNMNFSDLQEVYAELVKVYQTKLEKTKFWRKSNEDGA